jgi:5-methylcytosine-specific restriction endonuclease McrA
MALSKDERSIVWNKSGGRCWYCGNPLESKGWHADHFKPVRRTLFKKSYKDCGFGKAPKSIKTLMNNDGMQSPENDNIDNIVPACAPCNLFKSVFTIEEFRKEISLQAERARKSSVNFRTAERFGLIELRYYPVIFWFEKNDLMA